MLSFSLFLSLFLQACQRPKLQGSRARKQVPCFLSFTKTHLGETVVLAAEQEPNFGPYS